MRRSRCVYYFLIKKSYEDLWQILIDYIPSKKTRSRFGFYQVDYAKDPERDEDDIPPVEECIESFLQLLENFHHKEKIAAYIDEGIQYSGKL